MARTMTTAAVSRVNRRFLFLAFILAVLSAVLVYAAVSRSGGGGSSATEIEVVYAAEAITPGTVITADMLTIREVPSDAVPEGHLTSLDAAVGNLAHQNIAVNEPLSINKLVGGAIASNDAISYVVPEGMRGVAINIDRVINVSGLVLPGDHVDVLWIPRSGDPAYLLLSDVEVTAIEQTIADIAPAAPGAGEEGTTEETQSATDRTRASDAEPLPGAGTATLLLNLNQVKTAYCAEQFAADNGGSIRLAVRSFGDSAPAAPDAPACPIAPLPGEEPAP